MTKEKAEAVLADLREVCAKHGVILDGSCIQEGIGGEIEILDADPKFEMGVLQRGKINKIWNMREFWLVSTVKA